MILFLHLVGVHFGGVIRNCHLLPVTRHQFKDIQVDYIVIDIVTL